jgi:hypothetical protein
MKIKQFRNVLERTAAMHARLGAGSSAAAVRALASALKAHDSTTVEQFAADMTKLREKVETRECIGLVNQLNGANMFDATAGTRL